MCEHDIKRNEKHAKDYANCVKTNGIPLKSPPRGRFRSVNWLLGGGSMMVMAFFAIKGVLSKAKEVADMDEDFKAEVAKVLGASDYGELVRAQFPASDKPAKPKPSPANQAKIQAKPSRTSQLKQSQASQASQGQASQGNQSQVSRAKPSQASQTCLHLSQCFFR